MFPQSSRSFSPLSDWSPPKIVLSVTDGRHTATFRIPPVRHDWRRLQRLERILLTSCMQLRDQPESSWRRSGASRSSECGAVWISSQEQHRQACRRCTAVAHSAKEAAMPVTQAIQPTETDEAKNCMSAPGTRGVEVCLRVWVSGATLDEVISASALWVRM